MKAEMLEKGLTKFCSQKAYQTDTQFFGDVISHFNLEVNSEVFKTQLLRRFDDEFPCMGSFLCDKKQTNEVIDLMTHNRHGDLRAETSCGYGFHKGRKLLARENTDDVAYFLDNDDFTLPVLFNVALKDEFRKVGKDTRSIFVPQIYLWLVTMKYLGGLYDYFAFEAHKYGTVSFGLDQTVGDTTMNFLGFDFDATTYGFDLKQQDSKMSFVFIEFLVVWLKRHAPVSHHDAIDYIFEQGYLEKKIIDRYGNVVTTSNGEPSGFPLTILINSFHTFFLHSVSDLVSSHLGCDCHPIHRILGDDSISQMCHSDIYPQVCLLMNHETVSEIGSFHRDVSFLSMQFNVVGGRVEAYYANLPKAYASLRYTTCSHDEYYSKINAFRLLLCLAPEGTDAIELLNELDRYVVWYYRTHAYHLFESTNTYRTTAQNQGLLRSI